MTTPSDPQADARVNEYGHTVEQTIQGALEVFLMQRQGYPGRVRLKELQGDARDLREFLAAAGLVITAPDAPADGMVCISRTAARRAYSALVYLRVVKDEVQDDEEQESEQELRAVIRLAAAGSDSA